MKKILLLLLLSLTITGCSSKSTSSDTSKVDTEVSTETTTEKNQDESISDYDDSSYTHTPLHKFNSVESTEFSSEILDTSEIPDTSEILDTSDAQLTELFETIYVPYANKEKSFAFNIIKEFIQTTDYQIEIIEPSSEEIGTIKVIDEYQNYVYFAFKPFNGLDIIMTVSYFDAEHNAEVSLSNYSDDNSPTYDTLQVHVLGETNDDVNSVDEQRNFLNSLK